MPPVPPSGDNESLTVRIPAALKARLLDLASAHDVPAGRYVAEALEMWFAAQVSAPVPAPQPSQPQPEPVPQLQPQLEQLLAALPPGLAQLAQSLHPDDVADSRPEIGAPVVIDWNPGPPLDEHEDGDPIVREGPAEFEGVIQRAVERGGIIRAEVWGPDGWQRGGSLGEVLLGTPLAPDELDEAGNPKRR